MKFLGTTTVIAPVVLIILTIWMALAFASPAAAWSDVWYPTPFGWQCSRCPYGPTRVPRGFRAPPYFPPGEYAGPTRWDYDYPPPSSYAPPPPTPPPVEEVPPPVEQAPPPRPPADFGPPPLPVPPPWPLQRPPLEYRQSYLPWWAIYPTAFFEYPAGPYAVPLPPDRGVAFATLVNAATWGKW